MKNRLVYAILALFFGMLGVHNFYAGRTKQGVIQLILTLTCCGMIVSSLWALVEAFTVNTDGNGSEMDDSHKTLRIVLSLGIILLNFIVNSMSSSTFLPLLEAAREKRDSMVQDGTVDNFDEYDMTCPEHVEEILAMAQNYAAKNNGMFPGSIKQLQDSSAFDGNMDVFYCPSLSNQKTSSYIFLQKMKNDMNPNMPLLIEKIGNHPGTVTVGFVDGSVLEIKYKGQSYAGLLNYFSDLSKAEEDMLGKQLKAIDTRMKELKPKK